MADNSEQERSELNRLQQEAIRRAREMQARAQIPPPAPPRAEQSGFVQTSEEEIPPAPPQTRTAPAEPPAAPANPPAQPPASGGGESFLGGIGGSLDFLLKDTERSMLLILLLILMEEKADTSLIFAMMYLLI